MKRYAEMPQRYPGVAEQLRKARPQELHVDNRESWPQDNDNDEDYLRNQLADCAALTVEGVRKAIVKFDIEHAWRRATVWADLGDAPLAFALEQLVALADVTTQPLDAADLPSLTADYAERGWRADDAFLRALAAAPAKADRAAVSAAGSALYRAWADAGATVLQTIIGPMANVGTYRASGPASATAGVVSVFVDGLRLDIARRVQDRLTTAGLSVQCATGLAALPTVTTTAKAALVPVGKGALTAGPGLQPSNAVTGTTASIAVLRSLMDDNGVQILGTTDVGDPSSTGWTEVGELDHRGHDVGVRLVDYLDDEVGQIVGRIRELIDAGWLRVDVLTDHGWLLLPGGLEKVELPVAATEVKKGRCARVKEGAVVNVSTVPWFWDRDVRVAVAPGLTCFEAGQSYEHGGVSPQECIVPRLTVTAGASTTATGGPEITKVTWLGLLCRMLTRSGAKLLDFNIASRVGEPVRTQSGTPPYQASDANLTRWDVSNDLFAVGVMLFELLCNGEHPYPGSLPLAGESVIDPRTIRDDLRPEIAEFLVKAYAPYRSERFGTAQEMRVALEEARNGTRR